MGTRRSYRKLEKTVWLLGWLGHWILFLFWFIHSFIHLSIDIPLLLSTLLFTHHSSTSLPLHLSTYLSTHLSIYLLIHSPPIISPSSTHPAIHWPTFKYHICVTIRWKFLLPQTKSEKRNVIADLSNYKFLFELPYFKQKSTGKNRSLKLPEWSYCKGMLVKVIWQNCFLSQAMIQAQ